MVLEINAKNFSCLSGIAAEKCNFTNLKNQARDVIKIRDYPFLKKLFSFPLLISSLIFLTSHGWFLRHFVKLPEELTFPPFCYILMDGRTDGKNKQRKQSWENNWKAIKLKSLTSSSFMKQGQICTKRPTNNQHFDWMILS